MHNTAASPHGVSKLESNHRDVAGRSGIRQLTQRRSIPLSMSTVHCTIGGANACGFQSRINEAIDALRAFHSAANGVEWFERTPNNAQQT
ncbi:hypothetical protein TNCV_1159411 [Trichonephila clavipes]|nr:hypothetical protein TNCV_1159411 [Trichonephila clavipes]